MASRGDIDIETLRREVRELKEQLALKTKAFLELGELHGAVLKQAVELKEQVAAACTSSVSTMTFDQVQSVISGLDEASKRVAFLEDELTSRDARINELANRKPGYKGNDAPPNGKRCPRDVDHTCIVVHNIRANESALTVAKEKAEARVFELTADKKALIKAIKDNIQPATSGLRALAEKLEEKKQGPLPDPWICLECGEQFPELSSWKKHLMDEHHVQPDDPRWARRFIFYEEAPYGAFVLGKENRQKFQIAQERDCFIIYPSTGCLIKVVLSSYPTDQLGVLSSYPTDLHGVFRDDDGSAKIMHELQKGVPKHLLEQVLAHDGVHLDKSPASNGPGHKATGVPDVTKAILHSRGEKGETYEPGHENAGSNYTITEIEALQRNDPCIGCTNKDGHRCKVTNTYRFDKRSIPTLPCGQFTTSVICQCGHKKEEHHLDDGEYCECMICQPIGKCPIYKMQGDA